MRTLPWVFLALGCLGACASKDVAVSENPAGTALPIDHPPVPDLGTASARGQRLSIAQLRASLPILMGTELDGGPVTWRLGNGAPGLDAMALSLQEPDFIQITQEDLSPSPLYLKFMDDAARDVCNRALTTDLQRAGAARSLLRYVSNTDTPANNLNLFNQNLRYLKLKLHGVKVADTDDASIAPLRTLFTAGAAGSGSSVLEGWRAVCVALVTAPEFHLY